MPNPDTLHTLCEDPQTRALVGALVERRETTADAEIIARCNQAPELWRRPALGLLILFALIVPRFGVKRHGPRVFPITDLCSRIRRNLPDRGLSSTMFWYLSMSIARAQRNYLDEEAASERMLAASAGSPVVRQRALVYRHAKRCWFGLGGDVPAQELEAAYAAFNLTGYRMHSFVDAVEACRLDDAFRLLELPGADDRNGMMLLYRLMLDTVAGLELGRPPSAVACEAALEQLAAVSPGLAATTRTHVDLMLGRFRPETLSSFTDDDATTPSQLLAALPVRCALAIGATPAAERFMASRLACGLDLPLDGVLRARLRLATGDRASAAVELSGAISRAEPLRYEGRIDFEMRLARELGPAAAFRLAASTGGGFHRPPRRSATTDSFVGASREAQRVRSLIERYAATDLPVLITAPTGCGKEVAARLLHEASDRSERPLVVANCAALSEGLAERELFGHVRGAYTGADRDGSGWIGEADDGSLVLDEIGETSPHVQGMLLRLLDYGEYRPVGSPRILRARCRFVFATNADLDALVARGAFREDLLHRLRRLHIDIPPLAERPDDLTPLALHFLDQIGTDNGLDAAAIAWLRAQPWPGNARELRGVLERATTLAQAGTDLSAEQLARAATVRRNAPISGRIPLVPPQPAAAPPAGGGAAADPGIGGDARSRRLGRAAQFVRERGRVSRGELQAALDLSHATASAYLAELIARGLVRKDMPTASPRTHSFVWCGPA